MADSCDGVVNHVGEAVAIVAAPSRAAARAAVEALEVSYTPLEAVLDLGAADAREPLYSLHLECGDVEAALAAADVIVEGNTAPDTRSTSTSSARG